MTNINYGTVAKKTNYGLEINDQNGYNIGHIGHYISKSTDKAFNKANEYGHKWFGGGPGHEDEGGTDWYIGYNSENGMQIQINPGIPNTSQPQQTYKQQTYKEQPLSTTPNAYTANAAKTATSIKQGGMTKDEIINFNNRHPNETAQGVNL